MRRSGAQHDLSSEDDRGNLLADRARGLFWHLGLLNGRDASEEVHLFRLPYLCPLDELVSDPERKEERDVDVYNEKKEQVSIKKNEGTRTALKYAQEVMKLDALKFQKTVKPLMRMKIAIQNVPQYARYGCSGL